jgi:hypothetical protein
MPVAAWGDTTTYQNMSRLSLFDANFWAGRYPLTTPLLHKICSTQPDCIARFQVGLSIGAWLALGVAVILLIENRLMRIVSFAALMGLSLSSNFIGMNKVLLSESLSNSLFVLMTASWLLAGRYLSNNRALHQQVIVVFLLMPMMI